MEIMICVEMAMGAASLSFRKNARIRSLRKE
jgi:hypothetical protein